MPFAQFSVNKAIRIESIEALQRMHSQRLESEDSATKVEARKRLRNLASALKKNRRERTDAFRSTEDVHSGPMPSSTTNHILGLSWSKCTFSHILKDKKDASDRPFEVECTCIVCLGNSKYGKNDCSIVIDQRPRWTKTTPPKYVEKRLRCNHCGIIRSFLPINAGLESLPDVTIQKFYRGNHGLSDGDQLLMLQTIPSAARNHRWQPPKGQKKRTNRINQYRDLMPKYLEIRKVRRFIQCALRAADERLT